MTNIYEARWNKAKSLARQFINSLEKAKQKFGDKLIVKYGDEVIEDGVITIGDNEIILHATEKTQHILFINDSEQDMGSLSTIKEIEELFNELNIYVPYKG